MILKNANDEFSAAAVHGVMSVIHECVYLVNHNRVHLRKAESENTGTCEARSHLKEESSDILYRYCGAALHRMIKLTEETTAGRKRRGELFNKRKPVMQKELEILCELLMKDKSNIPASLKTLNEGNLKFPWTELLPFLESVDNEVRKFATDSNLRKYPSKFLTVSKCCIKQWNARNRLQSQRRKLPLTLKLLVVFTMHWYQNWQTPG